MSTPFVVASDLDERITIFRVDNEVDVVSVVTERFVALIDTTGTPDGCLRVLSALSPHLEAKPLIVINTHADWDHVWGNSAVADRAVIIAHEAAVPRLSSPTDGVATLRIKRELSDRFDEVILTQPHLTFDESLTLRGGDLTLELIHTPGHTDDHVAVWIPELALCIAGDTAEDPIPEVTDPTAVNFDLLRDSLRRLRDLNPRHVIPGHGASTSPRLLDDNLSYFDTVSARVATLPEGDPSDETPGLTWNDLLPTVRALTQREHDFYRACHRKAIAAASDR